MKLIALPDLHNGGKNYLPRLRAELAQVELLLLPGDISNGQVLYKFFLKSKPITPISLQFPAIGNVWKILSPCKSKILVCIDVIVC